jgi:hypothetical protein
MFQNGYALKIKIKDQDIVVELYGRHDKQTYILVTRKFDQIEDVYASVKEVAALPQYTPNQSEAK